MSKSVQPCPVCGKENSDRARFCAYCGANLTEERPSPEVMAVTQPQPTVAEAGEVSGLPVEASPASQPIPPITPFPVPPPPASPFTPSIAYPPAFQSAPRKRRFSWRCCGIGCLVVLLVLGIGLPILHLTVIRPIIEREIFKQIEKQAANTFQPEVYEGGEDFEFWTENKFNDHMDDIWQDIPWTSDERVQLEQDMIAVEAKVFGLKLKLGADVRADGEGHIVIQSIKMNWPLKLVVSEAGLKKEIAKYVNENILDQARLALIAFQVTDGQLFLFYDGR
jgi:hypothetical protein